MLKSVLASIMFLIMVGSTSSTAPEITNNLNSKIVKEVEISNSLKCSNSNSKYLNYYIYLQLCWDDCVGLYCCKVVPNPNLN